MRGRLHRGDRVRGTRRERLVPRARRADRSVRRDRPDALRVGRAAGLGIELTDGDVVAVVEAVCSDRLVVAGDLLLIDPAERRGSPTRHPGCRRRVPVLAGRRDPGRHRRPRSGDRRPRGRRHGRDREGAVGDDARPAEGSSWRRRRSATTSPSRSTPPPGRPSWSSSPASDPRTIVSTANDGTDMVRSTYRVTTGAFLDRARRPGDPGLLDVAARRRAVPADPQRPRGSRMGVRRFLAGNLHGVPPLAGIRGAPAQPARLVGTRTGFRVAGRGRHGRRRCVGPARRRRPRAGDGDRRSRRGSACSAAATEDSWRPCCRASTSGSPPPCPSRRSPIGISERFDSNLGAWVQEFLGGGPIDRQEHYRDRSPVFLAERNRTPTLLTAGTRDRATPIGQATEFYRALREHDVPAELALYPLEGHGVRTIPGIFDLVTRTVGWFERFMPRTRRLDRLGA